MALNDVDGRAFFLEHLHLNLISLCRIDVCAGAKQGLLVRGGDVLQRLASIDIVALDKVNPIFM